MLVYISSGAIIKNNENYDKDFLVSCEFWWAGKAY